MDHHFKTICFRIILIIFNIKKGEKISHTQRPTTKNRAETVMNRIFVGNFCLSPKAAERHGRKKAVTRSSGKSSESRSRCGRVRRGRGRGQFLAMKKKKEEALFYFIILFFTVCLCEKRGKGERERRTFSKKKKKFFHA